MVCHLTCLSQEKCIPHYHHQHQATHYWWEISFVGLTTAIARTKYLKCRLQLTVFPLLLLPLLHVVAVVVVFVVVIFFLYLTLQCPVNNTVRIWANIQSYFKLDQTVSQPSSAVVRSGERTNSGRTFVYLDRLADTLVRMKVDIFSIRVAVWGMMLLSRLQQRLLHFKQNVFVLNCCCSVCTVLGMCVCVCGLFLFCLDNAFQMSIYNLNNLMRAFMS